MTRPDVILAPPVLEGTSTVPLLRHFRSILPTVTFVILAENYGVDQITRNADLDISSVLLWRDVRSSTLRTYLRVAIDGRVRLVSNVVADGYLTAERNRLSWSVDSPEITDDEMVVLRGLAEELTRAEIATRLGVRPRTIDRHIEHLKEKLNVRTLPTLLMKATRVGLIP